MLYFPYFDHYCYIYVIVVQMVFGIGVNRLGSACHMTCIPVD